MAADRIEALRGQNAVTGIDFIYVHPNQVTLDVFFLRDPATLAAPLVNNVNANQIRIFSPTGGETLPEVPVAGVAWAISDGRDVLRVQTSTPGDFSRYRLHIEDARIDPYFNDIWFTFKANCKSDFDCKPKPHECPPEAPVDFPVNYLARDFWSFRRALTDFASERYPDWQDRLEADVGMMLVELMSGLGDEFAYSQDRIAREAYLETASQRRSLRKLARLVDYQVHDGLGASTWLDFTVAAGQSVNLAAGSQVWERRPESTGGTATERRAASKVVYEVGLGLADAGNTYAVADVRNEFLRHQWDEDDVCLPVGSTTLFIPSHHQADLPFDDFSDPNRPGKWVLLQTRPTDPSIQARAWMVRLISITDTTDPVFNLDITRLEWDASQATPFEMDMTVLFVRGNLVPATAGETLRAFFRIETEPPVVSDLPTAVERTGANDSVSYLFSLAGSVEDSLVWRGLSTDTAQPEVRLVQGTLAAGIFTPGPEWEWKRSLLGVNSSQPENRHFSLDDGFWKRVAGYRRIGREIEHIDYASNAGVTIRFGDGEFGLTPARGTIFEVTYRVGNGLAGNVTAGSLADFDAAAMLSIDAVTNPLPANDGLDAETPAAVRQLAPEAFRAVTFRAVKPEDYAEAAERLEWVERAGAEFRWTGSWLSAFVTPDPRGATVVSDERHRELYEQLDRFRQAGREAWGLDPLYANLDLEIRICVAPNSYSGEVKERVIEALFGKTGVRPTAGFFSPDNFTFGTPLWRSQLESAIHRVEGVRAVENMKVRRRGRTGWKIFSALVFKVAANEIVRVQNDPLLPERGSVKLVMTGGA